MVWAEKQVDSVKEFPSLEIERKGMGKLIAEMLIFSIRGKDNLLPSQLLLRFEEREKLGQRESKKHRKALDGPVEIPRHISQGDGMRGVLYLWGRN